MVHTVPRAVLRRVVLMEVGSKQARRDELGGPDPVPFAQAGSPSFDLKQLASAPDVSADDDIESGTVVLLRLVMLPKRDRSNRDSNTSSGNDLSRGQPDLFHFLLSTILKEIIIGSLNHLKISGASLCSSLSCVYTTSQTQRVLNQGHSRRSVDLKPRRDIAAPPVPDGWPPTVVQTFPSSQRLFVGCRFPQMKSLPTCGCLQEEPRRAAKISSQRDAH